MRAHRFRGDPNGGAGADLEWGGIRIRLTATCSAPSASVRPRNSPGTSLPA